MSLPTCGLLLLVVPLAASLAEIRTFGLNETCLLSTKSIHIPISPESDFGEGMNRDWMEGYYSSHKSYFRLYMAVYDEKNYPAYKDIWQDKSGHIVISGNGVLWIGFGRPARQIEFAKKYKEQGKKKHESNKPLIRSILVEASTITKISGKSVEERFRSHGLDINVDVTKSPNQFGLASVSTEFLRQNALSHSMVTYYLVKPTGNHPEWGLVESVDVLKRRVKKYDMNRIIPKKEGDTWITEDLFNVKDDVSSLLDKCFDIDAAEKTSAAYKDCLIKREVLLGLIEEVKWFYTRGGEPYNILKASFLAYVKENIIDSFRLGEDVTTEALNAIETSLLGNMTKENPSKGADLQAWARFKTSVDQVKTFVSYVGTQIKLGTANKIVNDWPKVGEDYQTLSAEDANHVIPKLQLARESTSICIRMAFDQDVPPRQLCGFIKRNFMGCLVANLQLISRQKDSDELITYAKRTADCLEQDDKSYAGKPLKSTVVTIYGHDQVEYRYYPDAQVVGSTHVKGTVFLFSNGAPENLRIRGKLLTLKDILLEASLQKEMPALMEKLDAVQRAGGLVVIPQKYIDWKKKVVGGDWHMNEPYRRFNSTH